jgi:hypothetical protein
MCRPSCWVRGWLQARSGLSDDPVFCRYKREKADAAAPVSGQLMETSTPVLAETRPLQDSTASP